MKDNDEPPSERDLIQVPVGPFVSMPIERHVPPSVLEHTPPVAFWFGRFGWGSV